MKTYKALNITLSDFDEQEVMNGYLQELRKPFAGDIITRILFPSEVKEDKLRKKLASILSERMESLHDFISPISPDVFPVKTDAARKVYRDFNRFASSINNYLDIKSSEAIIEVNFGNHYVEIKYLNKNRELATSCFPFTRTEKYTPSFQWTPTCEDSISLSVCTFGSVFLNYTESINIDA